VIYKNLPLYKNLAALQNTLKWIELIALGAFLVGVFWVFYNALCFDTTCRQSFVNEANLIKAIQVAMPLAAFVGMLRTAVVFLLNDRDSETETLFYLSLLGVVLSYSIVGWFFPVFLDRGQNYFTESPVFVAAIITLLITIALLLADRQTWDKSNVFVRLRVSLSLIHLVLLLINPLIGLLASIIILPVLVLMYSGTALEPLEDKPENIHS
jgi:hypothetical protein